MALQFRWVTPGREVQENEAGRMHCCRSNNNNNDAAGLHWWGPNTHIRAADVNADYTVRPDPAETVRQLRTLAKTVQK